MAKKSLKKGKKLAELKTLGGNLDKALQD